MLGRGVKRKRDVQEEDQQQHQVRTWGNKDAADSDTSPASTGVAYLQQRQLVLTLCLDKLQGCQILSQGCQARTEPSLHRSVLLINTLRQIQEEMRQEGTESSVSALPAIVPPASTTTAAAASSPLHTSTPLPSSQQRPSLTCVVPVTPVSPSTPYPTPQELFDLSGLDVLGGLLTCTSCFQVEYRDDDDDGLEVSLISSSLTPTSPPTLLSSDDPYSLDGRVRGSGGGGFHSLLGSFELVNSPCGGGSYLSDLALDDIFEDIDTSMYDASDVSSILGSLGSSRVAASLSLSSVSSLSLGGGEGGLKWGAGAVATATCPSSATALQLCLSEVSDLDHIMEVLVGS